MKNKLGAYRKSVLKAAFEGRLVEKRSDLNYKKLSELCDINPSKKEVKDFDIDTEVTFLPMASVSKKGKIVYREKKKIKDVIKGYTYFKDGDVLLAKITPCFENGKRAIAKDLKNGIGFGSTEFHIIRPKEKVTSDWIFFSISRDDFKNEAKNKMTGTAGQKRVPARIVENFKIPVPKVQEQT
ncbi:MAG: restriction endonuclease subunit S, partial [Candidatus Altarchaeum sp. CG03_land_8_20_14_0_80_32_618]